MTKDEGDHVDMLRAVMKGGEYQIAPESEVLERRARERERRKERGMARAKAACPTRISRCWQEE